MARRIPASVRYLLDQKKDLYKVIEASRCVQEDEIKDKMIPCIVSFSSKLTYYYDEAEMFECEV